MHMSTNERANMPSAAMSAPTHSIHSNLRGIAMGFNASDRDPALPNPMSGGTRTTSVTWEVARLKERVEKLEALLTAALHQIKVLELAVSGPDQ